ncbi:Autoinducer 2 sensor kinase/phosphatase LuxQ [bacterium HR30]|nr:Autoinducer 2 sensor kinase/phosphatase LuxQ [bacterium HR30]
MRHLMHGVDYELNATPNAQLARVSGEIKKVSIFGACRAWSGMVTRVDEANAYAREREILTLRQHAWAASVAAFFVVLFGGPELYFFPERLPFLMLWVATSCIPILMLWRARRRLLRRRAVTLATAVVVFSILFALLGYAAMTGADASIIGANSAVVLLVLAVLLPWPPLYQVLAGAPALVGFPLLVWYQRLGARGIYWYAIVAAAVAASVFISRHLDIQRRAIFRESRARDEAMIVTRSLLKMARELASAMGPSAVLDCLVERTRNLLQVDWCAILLETSVPGVFRIAAGSASRDDLLQEGKGLEIRAEEYPTLRRVSDPGSILEVSRCNPPDPRWRALMRYFRTRSMLVTPLERNGQVVGLLAVGRGRTEDPFPVRHHRILQGIARQATIALENARLYAELEQANRLKSEFVATMSHELRTPLNIVIGYADLLAEGAFGLLPEDALEPLQRIRQQSRELLRLINATLDVNRLESGTVALNVSETSLEPFVRALREQLLHSPRASGVDFVTKVRRNGLLRTDLEKVAIILRNLVGNAFKFTPQGAVSLEAEVAGDGVARFVVRDTGIGIPESEKDRIFEMFYQVPRPGEVPGGVGLGLYIVRRFVDLLQGRIEVESGQGRGTVFTVEIPSLARNVPHLTTGSELEDG